MARKLLSSQSDSDYFNKERWNNELTRLLLASSTKRALAVALLDVDGNHRFPSTDNSTFALNTIEYEHHEVHSGSSYHVGYSVVTANSNDDVTAIMFTTPNTTKWIHIIATFNCSNPAEAVILENPTLADAGDGSDKLVLNRNRNSSNTSMVQSLEDTPTVGSVTTMNEAEWTAVGVSGGTELEHEFLQGGDGKKAVGGVSRGTQEWVLDQGKTYVFYLQNTGAAENTHSISLDWYEHTDKA